MVHKVIRNETALDTIENLRYHDRLPEDAISMQFQGSFVYCEYSNQTYMVDGMIVRLPSLIVPGIDWDKRVTDTFTRETKRGKEDVSFKDYFAERYGYKIRNNRLVIARIQPLIVLPGNPCS